MTALVNRQFDRIAHSLHEYLTQLDMARTVVSFGALVLATGMSLLMLSAAAQSNTPKPGQKLSTNVDSLEFNIPAQPMQNALDAFGALTGYSGLYSATATAGRMSAPVIGRFKPDVALRMLIESSGLSVHYTAADAFVLEQTFTTTSPTAQANVTYDGLLQRNVRDVFCRDPLIASGSYRMALRFYLDKRGHLNNPSLLDTTGDVKRDAAILTALLRIDLGQGPVDTSQPFFMLILPQAFVPGRDCVVH